MRGINNIQDDVEEISGLHDPSHSLKRTKLVCLMPPEQLTLVFSRCLPSQLNASLHGATKFLA
jgi:hypothetical protein